MSDIELSHEFFDRPTAQVAHDLIGKKLVRKLGRSLLMCRIVEAEAYLPANDDACHASRKKTPRNEVMFGEPGRIYVYSIHAKFCFNLVTEQPGQGCAVLVRSAIPLLGQDVMRRNRSLESEFRLLSGPAKLCQAIEIDKQLNGQMASQKSGLWIVDDGFEIEQDSIRVTPRIGVTSAKEKKLRYVLRGSPFASGPKYLR